ncbi:hypothetical protein GQR58_016742 [Nymphon striatum]|nr:hypothetical protein GQR58_016742 [Nymphon striatum]
MPVLPRRRLMDKAIPTIFPNCPSYMSHENMLPRSKNATSENRVKESNNQLTNSISQMFEADVIQNIDEILRKLESEESIPAGFNWVVKNGDLLLLYIEATSVPVRLLGCIAITSNLDVTITVNEELVDTKLFNGVLGVDMKANSFSAVLNLMACAKSEIEKLDDNYDQHIHRKSLQFIEEYASVCDDEVRSKVKFFAEQINLVNKPKAARRYAPETLIMCYLLYCASPSGYKELRKQNFLTIPSERTLQTITNKVGNISEFSYLNARVSKLKHYEKNVILIIDEIYSAKRTEYSAAKGQIFGVTDDGEVAQTLLGFMISSIAGPYRDMVSLFPMKKINVKKLKTCCFEVLKLLDKIGLNVVAISVDNHPVNRSFFVKELCGGFLKPSIKNPINGNQLFLLLDPVHTLKNLYNNFQSKKIFDFPNFNSNDPTPVHFAKFQDLHDLYDLEATKPIKLAHSLTNKALNPKSIEKTSVKLSLAVFNESTKNALEFFSVHEGKQWEGTAEFIRIVLTLWAIVNVRTTTAGKHKRDLAKEPIYSYSDWQISYLFKFRGFLERWQSSSKKCLSKETFLAVHHMCSTFPVLIKHVIEQLGFKYILLGKFQSDIIESRFGWYRQLSGANYFISVKQILESERKIKAASLLRFSGLSELNSACDDHPECELEQQEIDNFVCHLNDEGFVDTDLGDRNAVFYVAGALVRSIIRNNGCTSCRDILCNGRGMALTHENLDEVDEKTGSAGSVAGVIEELKYNGAVRFHKLLNEALLRLAWKEFLAVLDQQSDYNKGQIEEMNEKIMELCEHLNQNTFTDILHDRLFETVAQQFGDILDNLRQGNGTLVAFWMGYIQFHFKYIYISITAHFIFKNLM